MGEQIGPVYSVDSKHSYGHDFASNNLQKESHGPVFEVERQHKYGVDFSVRHRPSSPINGPIMPVDRSHNYKAPLTKPHQRDLRARSYTPTYEVNKSHHYRESTTHKSDLTQMVGPICNTGKINHLAKHNFTDGYQAPKARQDQVELVGKFFKKQEEYAKYEESKEVKSEQTVSQSKEERKAEAIQRREEFLKKKENIDMNITTSEYKTVDVKTRQQIEEEREAYIQQTVMKIQQEALGLKERIKMEENSRLKIEEVKRQEAMQRAEEERKRKELARI